MECLWILYLLCSIESADNEGDATLQSFVDALGQTGAIAASAGQFVKLESQILIVRANTGVAERRRVRYSRSIKMGRTSGCLFVGTDLCLSQIASRIARQACISAAVIFATPMAEEKRGQA